MKRSPHPPATGFRTPLRGTGRRSCWCTERSAITRPTGRSSPRLFSSSSVSMPSHVADAERRMPPTITPWKTKRGTCPTWCARLAPPSICSDTRTAPTARCSPRPRSPTACGSSCSTSPPGRSLIKPDALAALETLAAAGAWDQFAFAFFANTLHVPIAELDAVRASELWPPIVADARASLGDLRAMRAIPIRPGSFRGLDIPVMLQVGSESPRDLYVTDALAAVLPNVADRHARRAGARGDDDGAGAVHAGHDGLSPGRLERLHLYVVSGFSRTGLVRLKADTTSL